MFTPLTVILVSNIFLAVGIVMFINGMIHRKKLSLAKMVILIFGGSFMAIAAAMIDVAVLVFK